MGLVSQIRGWWCHLIGASVATICWLLKYNEDKI